MKLLKQLLTAGLCSLALAAAVQAQTEVRLTGSTAFRSATHNAIRNVLGAGVTFAFTGATLGSASQAIFTGSVNGSPVIVKTSWSGSVGGIQTVSQGLNVNFLPNGTAQSTGGTSGAPTAGLEPGIPDIAMADNAQNFTPFTTPPLTDIRVGVVPFKWVASAGSPAGLNNITPQLAKALFGAGSLSLTLFTGLPADEANKVFATGRDPDSGTRVITFAESGVGVFSSVVQFQPVVSGTNIASHIPWPVTTVNGITFAEGNGGFASGGNLVNVMNKTTNGLGGFYVSYMGLSDANLAVAGGAKELTFNGVLYSDAGVKQGSYTFWSYQHLMYKSTLEASKVAVATAIANRIIAVDSPVLLSQMRVGRFSDGATVTPNF